MLQENLPPITDLPLPASTEEYFNTCMFFLLPSQINNKQMKETPGKGKWSEVEDRILLNAMANCDGKIRWSDISKQVPGRTAKQCRERWQFRLNPDINKTPYQQWEDDYIIQLREAYGNHWTQIADKLPGRTSCSIKNRWYTVLKHRTEMGILRRKKIISHRLYPFYYETLILRDRRELWEKRR